jgi:septal ring factor EnvC (AmiA/AmiB activator)
MDSSGEKLRINIDVLRGRTARATLGFGLAVLLLTGLAHAQDIENAVELEGKVNADSAASQQRIDKIDDQTDSMASDYRSTLEQIESLRVYNRQLEKLVASQEAELASLDEQIGNVTVISRAVTPMMLRMVEALDQFVALDVPLLPNERSERVARLREILDRADVEDAEKYRRIIEAYQIENEYGRTIEAYQDTLTMGGEERTLEFLRVGRVSLMYSTLDGNEVGAWDQDQRAWVQLGDEFKDSIRKGIRIARKQMAPDMIRLPVTAPENAQ